MLPHLLQNFALTLSLLPQLMQNFISGSSVALSSGVSWGGDITSVGDADSTPLYISVTAPLGLKESSMSGTNSGSFLLPFSSRYSIRRGPRSPFGRFTGSPSQIANFLSVMSGVEKVSEWVDMYSSVADLPLNTFAIIYEGLKVDILIIVAYRTCCRTWHAQVSEYCRQYSSLL